MNNATIDRFWAKVDKSDGCWIWKASKRHKGYGAFVWADDSGNVVQGRAHRFSWGLVNGPIPPGQCVLHRCDNPACVRPDHLFLGTKADNNNDMHAKGRHVSGGTRLRERGELGAYKRGLSHHMAKMDAESVRALRADVAGGMSLNAAGRRYGIKPTTVFKIVHRITWRHVHD